MVGCNVEYADVEISFRLLRRRLCIGVVRQRHLLWVSKTNAFVVKEKHANGAIDGPVDGGGAAAV